MDQEGGRERRGYDLEVVSDQPESEESSRWPGRRTLVEDELERAAFAARRDGPAGQALAGSLRADLERGFGTRLDDIRLHDDAASATQARSLDALAFARGSDLHFAAGQLAPESRSGRRLIAHEVAHALQARGATGTDGGAPPPPGSDPAERQADLAAARVMAGGRATVQPTGGPLRIHAFQPHEHRDIGDEAGGGELEDITLDDGSVLTFGEMTALADYIGSIDTIRALAENAEGQLRIRWTLWFARVRHGDEPAYAGADQARDDWYKELANNGDHFGARGQEAYEQHHAQALYDGYWEAFGDRKKGGARAAEAFAHHYLNDLFAGGHIRTQRQEIQDYCAARYSSSGQQILEYMVSYIANVIENETTAGKVLGGFDNTAENAVRDKITAKAGGVLGTITLGHIIASAVHDADNKGLGVISDVNPSGQEVPGGFKWTAMGDKFLNTAEAAITKEMAVAAARASLLELDDIMAYGDADAAVGPAKSETEIDAAAMENLALFSPPAALAYVPRPDPEAGNVEYDTEWQRDDPFMRSAVDDYLKTTIHEKLIEFVDKIEETQVINGTTYHPREAFQAFCNHLAAVGIGVLDGAVPKFEPHDPSYGTGQDD